MIRPIILLSALTLAGCTTSGSAQQAVYVDREVPVSCVPADFSPAPASGRLTADQLKAKPDAAGRYQALSEYWVLIDPLVTRDEAVITACRAAAPAPKK